MRSSAGKSSWFRLWVSFPIVFCTLNYADLSADAQQFSLHRGSKVTDPNLLQCQSCLLVTIKKISAHNGYMYKSDHAKLDVVVEIEDVIKAGTLYGTPGSDTGFRKGATVTFVLDDPELLARPNGASRQIVGTRTIWAIDFWRIEPGFYHLDKLFEPYRGNKVTAQDIEQVKSKLQK